jgi:regulator of sigma E protease
MVLGFGFVVFFHELGHFLAAKWVGIKVEQFAVGFGNALFAWRKGIGVRVGTTRHEYLRLCEKHLQSHADAALSLKDAPAFTEQQITRAADELGLGETEYRLNWLPLGGYVKMLGQDDLRPNSGEEDPRAYNRKSVGARMVVVSAGVIMNVILAAIGFMIVFMIGLKVQPAVVGSVLSNSPAQRAGFEVGDRILYLDGHYQHDYTKILLNVALLKDGEDSPVLLKRAGTGKLIHTAVRALPNVDQSKFLAIGVSPISTLEGPSLKDKPDEDDTSGISDGYELKPGDKIVQVGDVPIPDPEHDFYLLDQAVQKSGGSPVKCIIEHANGKRDTIDLQPRFEATFGTAGLNIAGMNPRPRITYIDGKSSAAKDLKIDDVVTAVDIVGSSDHIAFPTTKQFQDIIQRARDKSRTINLTVERDGKSLTFPNLGTDTRVGDHHGLGVGIGYDELHPVVSGSDPNSSATRAQVPNGATIKTIDGKPVRNWFDIQRDLVSNGPNAQDPRSHTIAWVSEDGRPGAGPIVLDNSEVEYARNLRYAVSLLAKPLIFSRKAPNPWVAAGWGITETRDLMEQFYVTLVRMKQGSVSVKNLMGPVGIFSAGASFASRGPDWLIWFLAMISANLAVVNFLPIPIVDGGLFTFLIIEKIQGRPLSSRTQMMAQIVGFALIIGVFLLVTYGDIARMVGH